MSEEPAPSLQRGVLGQREVVFQALSHLGPVVGIILIGPVIAAYVGASTPLLLLIAIVAVLLTGSSVAALARRLPSAGGYYSYVSHGLGERFGFVTAWAYFLYDPFLPTLTLLASAGILAPVLQSELGVDVPWWAIALVLLALVFTATYLGVKLSAGLTLALGVAETVILIAFAIATLVRHGGLSAAPLQWPHTDGQQPVFLAFAFAVLLFTGFESAAPLAEETANPRRAIPRTIIWSIVIVGLVWALAAYSMVIGWGLEQATDLGTADNPFFVIADRISGWAWILLALALLNSALAGALAGQNAGARVIYALSRSGVLPRALAWVHPRWRTPAVALAVTTLLNVAACLSLGFWIGPMNGLTFIGVFITLSVIVVYAMGNLSVIRLYRTRFRADWHWIKHGVVPVLGTAVLAVGLYYSVWPLPPWPIRLAVWIVAVWLVLGVAVALLLWRTRRAALVRAAELMFEEDEPAAPTLAVKESA